MGMPWLKHYNNASTSMALQGIIEKGGAEAYGHYWLLLELLCTKYDGTSHEIDLFEKEIVKQLGINCRRIGKQLDILCNSYSIQFERIGKLYSFKAPILSELKDKDFRRTRHRPGTDAAKIKINIKDKDKINNKSTTTSVEEIETLESLVKLTDKVFALYQQTEMYPRDLFDQVAKEAYPLFVLDKSPGKQWDRFLGHYLRNNKEKIRNFMIESAKEQEQEESRKKFMAEHFPEHSDV